MRYNLIPAETLLSNSFEADLSLYLSTDIDKKICIGKPEEGIIILSPYGEGYIVLYLYVVEKMRGQGVSKALLYSALDYCKEQKRKFVLKIVYSNTYSDFLKRFATENELYTGPCMYLHLVDRSKKDINAVWENLSKRLLPLQQHYMRAGYRVCCFGEEPSVVHDSLEAAFHVWDSEKREVPVDMYPYSDDVYAPLSFICYKEDNPIAYLKCSRHGNSVVVRELLVLRSHRNGPGLLLVTAPFFASIVPDKKIERTSFMHLSTNARIIKHTERYYLPFVYKTVSQELYFMTFDDNEDTIQTL